MTRTQHASAFLIVAAALTSLGTQAQTTTPAAAPTEAEAKTQAAQARDLDGSLYLQLGGQPGIVKLIDDLVDRLIADSRMNPFFKDANHKQLKEQLVAQFCEVSGGPCKRKGPDMKTAHAGMDITKSNFNALVEVLQQSMNAQGIAFSTQNKLLAKLAPMHRDIINTP